MESILAVLRQLLDMLHLVSAIIGAIIVLLLNESAKWWKKPKLIIEFQQADSSEPHIFEFTDSCWVSEDFSRSHARKRIGVRLKVKNEGKKPAKNCIAKLKLWSDGELISGITTLGWSSRDDILFQDVPDNVKIRERIKPMTIYPGDGEFLDFLILDYDEVTNVKTGETKIEKTGLLRTWGCLGGTAFLDIDESENMVEIIVIAENGKSQPLCMKIHWNGGTSVEDIKKSLTSTDCRELSTPKHPPPPGPPGR